MGFKILRVVASAVALLLAVACAFVLVHGSAPIKAHAEEVMEVQQPDYEGYSSFGSWLAVVKPQREGLIAQAEVLKTDYADILTQEQVEYIDDVISDVEKANIVQLSEQGELIAALSEELAALQSLASQAVTVSATPAYQHTGSSGTIDYGYDTYNGSLTDFYSLGVINYGGYRYTYYSSNVAYHYRTPEWTLDSNGYWRDSDGYYVVASSDHAQGDTVNMFDGHGLGKVYDTGCASGTLDVYTGF